MSRFYGSLEGERGMATRVGRGRISGHIRGWRIGVKVDGSPLADDQTADVFVVYVTGGSSGTRGAVCIGSVRETEDGRVFRLDDRMAERLGLPNMVNGHDVQLDSPDPA